MFIYFFLKAPVYRNRVMEEQATTLPLRREYEEELTRVESTSSASFVCVVARTQQRRERQGDEMLSDDVKKLVTDLLILFPL